MIYDRVLIQIRERSFLDLLDLALLLIRERPVTLGLAAALGIGPFAALNLWLLSDPQFPRSLWYFLLVIETPWATAPLTLVLGDLMFGAPLSGKRYLKTLVVALPTMVLTQFIARGLLALSVVGYVLAMDRFAFLNEVILLERVKWFRAVRRMTKLGRGVEGEIRVRWLIQVAFGWVFALCFWSGTRAMGSTFAGGELTWYQPGMNDLSGHLFQAGVWIAIAFFGVYRFLAYIDRRIRLEGWEVELRLRDAARALEEGAN